MLGTTLNTSRMLVGGMTVGLLAIAGASRLIQPTGGLRLLVGPAGLLGLVSLVIGYRLYCLLKSRVPPDADTAVRCGVYLRANILAMAVTEGVGLLGVIVHADTGEWPALIGVVTHVILAGAIWPSREGLELFLNPGAASSGEV